MDINILKKCLKYKTILQGSAFSIFSFINKSISFILLIILASFIKPYEYGQLSMYTTLVELLSYFIAFSSSGYIAVSFFKKEYNEFKKDFNTVLLLGLLSLIPISIILLVGNQRFESLFNLPPRVLWISVAVCFLTLFHNINLDLFRIKSNIIWFGIFSCGYASLNFATSLIFVVFCEQNWMGRVNAQLISTIVMAIVAIIIFIKNKLIDLTFERNRIRTILFWGMPLIPHLASNWIKSGCDRMIINNHYSMDEVGIFSFALNMTSIITMVGFGFNQANSVDVYKLLSNNDYSENEKLQIIKKQRLNMLRVYLVLYIIIVALSIIIFPLILPEYSASILYFIPLSLYGLGVCVYLLYCNYLFYYGKNKIIMYTTFSSSIIHLFLSLFFTRYSLLCTAIIYVITQLFIVFVVKYQSDRVVNYNLNNA